MKLTGDVSDRDKDRLAFDLAGSHHHIISRLPLQNPAADADHTSAFLTRVHRRI
jgi:hypothetical protein